jgi:hypothetical protein
LNSDFNNNDNVNGITCQGCHVPRIQSGVVLSANYLFLLPKSPFGLHHFAGANTFMLHMLDDHANALEVSADSVQFDSTIMRTERMLQQNSLLVHAGVNDRTSDTAFVDVKLTNLAGHKFPSGYPSRRAWVELITTNALGDTLFHSGGWNGTYEVNGHPATWEQHWDMINDPQQAQIYEMVMADVNGNKTTTLERAATKLKDNRLPPAGFTTTHYAYDTATIANVPASDIDFNHDDLGIEGSGSDIVHYHVPMGGYTGAMNVYARVWYQSSPPKWMEEMFAYNSAEIDTFKTYYQHADNSPVLVREDHLNDLSLAIDNLEELGVRIFPNPVHDALLTVLGLDARVLGVEVYDMAGKLIAQRGTDTQRQWRLRLPPEAATYIVAVRTRDRVFTQRIVSF